MDTLLRSLWSVTQGAWLTAAAICLVRLVFRQVLTPKAKYYLWLLLALRLMLPVVPESPVSLMNLLTPKSTRVETVQEVSAAPQEAGETALPAVSQKENLPAVSQAPATRAAASNAEKPLSRVLFWLWIGGMALTLTVYGMLYLVTAVRLRRLPVCSDSDTLRVFLRLKRACGIRGDVLLLGGGAGMLGGLVRPAIVLPVERHGQDAAPILLHELMHYQAKDLWLSLLFRLLTAVYWFNPVVWLCFRWAGLDCEAACDQRVLETGLVAPGDYAGALYEEGALRTMRKGVLTTFGGRRHSLKRRIRGIARFRGPKLGVTVLTVLLALGITACTMTGASSPSSAASPNDTPGQEALQSYMAKVEPPNGSFGLTLQEHIDQGLLRLEDGEVADASNSGIERTQFITQTELGGQTVEITYLFSQTALSQEKILTQVFVTPPTDLELEDWLDALEKPWLEQLTRDTDYNGLRWNTQEYVGDFMTAEQLSATAEALVAWGQAHPAPDAATDVDSAAFALSSRWRVVSAFYTENAELWQFNGTGAALLAALQREESPQADQTPAADGVDSTASSQTPTLTETIAPYTQEAGLLSYEGLNWSVTPSEVSAGLSAPENWALLTQEQPVLHGSSPLGEHPEVTDIYYRFGFTAPELTMELRRVETHYDPAQISYETLLAQRTQELGPPTDQTNRAYWDFGEVQLELYPDRDGRIQEWLCRYVNTYEDSQLADADILAYIQGIQPPIGLYGCTYEEHVAAGLLDPDQGTLETQGEQDVTFHTFTTTVSLGGYQVSATYCFTPTLASLDSGLEVLTEINVTPPEGVPLSQWLAQFSGPYVDRMLQGQNSWSAPFSLGPLLTEAQRQTITQRLLGNNPAVSTLEEAETYLDQWKFSGCFYDAARGFVFNGTGVALYLTANGGD